MQLGRLIQGEHFHAITLLLIRGPDTWLRSEKVTQGTSPDLWPEKLSQKTKIIALHSNLLLRSPS
jgi:hypothetical protein